MQLQQHASREAARRRPGLDAEDGSVVLLDPLAEALISTAPGARRLQRSGIVVAHARAEAATGAGTGTPPPTPILAPVSTLIRTPVPIPLRTPVPTPVPISISVSIPIPAAIFAFVVVVMVVVVVVVVPVVVGVAVGRGGVAAVAVAAVAAAGLGQDGKIEGGEGGGGGARAGLDAEAGALQQLARGRRQQRKGGLGGHQGKAAGGVHERLGVHVGPAAALGDAQGVGQATRGDARVVQLAVANPVLQLAQGSCALDGVVGQHVHLDAVQQVAQQAGAQRLVGVDGGAAHQPAKQVARGDQGVDECMEMGFVDQGARAAITVVVVRPGRKEEQIAGTVGGQEAAVDGRVLLPAVREGGGEEGRLAAQRGGRQAEARLEAVALGLSAQEDQGVAGGEPQLAGLGGSAWRRVVGEGGRAEAHLATKDEGTKVVGRVAAAAHGAEHVRAGHGPGDMHSRVCGGGGAWGGSGSDEAAWRGAAYQLIDRRLVELADGADLAGHARRQTSSGGGAAVAVAVAAAPPAHESRLRTLPGRGWRRRRR